MLNSEGPIWDTQLVIDEDTELILEEENKSTNPDTEGDIEFTVGSPITISVEKEERTVYGITYSKKINTYHETVTQSIIPRDTALPTCESNCACCYQPYSQDMTRYVYTRRCYEVDTDDGTGGNVGDEMYYDVYNILSPSVEYRVSATAIQENEDNIRWSATSGNWSVDSASEGNESNEDDNNTGNFSLYSTLVSSPSANKHPLSGYLLLMKRVKSTLKNKVVTTGSYLVPSYNMGTSSSMLGASLSQYVSGGRELCFTSETFPYDPENESISPENTFMCSTGTREECIDPVTSEFNQMYPFEENQFTFQTPQCQVLTKSGSIYDPDIITTSPLSVRVKCTPGSTVGINLVLYDGAFSLIRKRAEPVLMGQSSTYLKDILYYNLQISNAADSGGVVRMDLVDCKYRTKYTEQNFNYSFTPTISYSEHYLKSQESMIFRAVMSRVIAMTNTNIYSTGYTCTIQLSDHGTLLDTWEYTYNGSGKDDDNKYGSTGVHINAATFNPLDFGERIEFASQCGDSRTMFSYGDVLYCSNACTSDETFDAIPSSQIPSSVLEKLQGDIGKCIAVDCISKYGQTKPTFDVKQRTCTLSPLIDIKHDNTGSSEEEKDDSEESDEDTSPLPELPCGDHGTYIPEPTHACACDENYVTVIDPETMTVKYCSEYRKPPPQTPGTGDSEEEEEVNYVKKTDKSGFKFEILIVVLVVLAVVGTISGIIAARVVKKRKRQGKPGCMCQKSIDARKAKRREKREKKQTSKDKNNIKMVPESECRNNNTSNILNNPNANVGKDGTCDIKNCPTDEVSIPLFMDDDIPEEVEDITITSSSGSSPSQGSHKASSYCDAAAFL